MSITVKINRWDDHCRSLYLYHSDIGKYYEVSVMQTISIDDFKPEEPQVNWASFGSVEPAKALAFSESLKAAAEIASLLNSIEKWGTLPIEEIKAWAGINEKPTVRVTKGEIKITPP